MSDIVIPGVTGKFDTDKIIKALMDVKRVRLDRMTETVKDYREKKSAWQEINRKLSSLRESSKNLFNYENPFNEKIAESSNESVLTAFATREADEIERKIIVEQIAKADRFISMSLDRKINVEAGIYQFKVGEKDVQIKFSGGSLREFADAINKKSDGLLKAEVIYNTNNSQVIIIEGGKTGSKNKVEFIGKSLEFGIKTGMLETVTDPGTEISLTKIVPEKWETPLQEDLFKIEDNILSLNPQAELKIPIKPALKLNPNMVMEIDISIEELSETELEEIAPPAGPGHPDSGDLSFEGVTIENEKSKVILPEWEAPPPPERIDDMNILFAGSDGKIIQLPAVDRGKPTQKMTIPIGQLADRITSLYFRNRNTHRKIDLSNIRIYDPTVRGGYRPVNPVSESQDAVIIMDGIKVVRETNEIDDVIPGVTLNLESESTQSVQLNVKRDVDTIVDSLITFVGNYNQVLTTIDILTRNNEDIVEAIAYFTDDEKEKAKQQLGMLQGDVMLMQLKRTFQNIMMNPYKTRRGSDLSLLAQIGISSNAGKPGTSAAIDKTKLRGYLNIDEATLKNAITNNADWIKDLFGMDTDKDLVVDSGVAFSIDKLITPYTQTGGLLKIKFDNFDSKIAATEKDIDEYNEYLDDYEAKLRKDYATMEGALDQLEKSSKALDNLNIPKDK